MGADWSLSQCCAKGQWITLGIIGGSALLGAALWYTPVILPFKLLTVFLHEFGHASAAWMTGGQVDGIEVQRNEGGLTTSRGGVRWVILPAGYLGSCCWGMFFILMASVNIWSMRVAAGILCILLLGVLVIFAKNWVLRFLCVGFVILVVGLWAATEVAKTVWPLRVVLVFIGVMNGLYSVWDIWDDLIRRKVPESDAYKFAELTKCNSRFCGVVWAVFAICVMGFTVYLILVITETGDDSFK